MINLIIELSAVVLCVEQTRPKFLGLSPEPRRIALPSGPFDPGTDRTLERAVRGWVQTQTGFPLGHVEQLYTFGDQNREIMASSPEDMSQEARIISVGYLALTPKAAKVEAGFEAEWYDWYAHFPWEDHRKGPPALIAKEIAPRLLSWADGDPAHLERARLAFGLDGRAWIEERVLERYELLYEARLVCEAWRDEGSAPEYVLPGLSMVSDHRRILATAISRLRGKLKYRPVLFDLIENEFTLSALQKRAEAILGLPLHKQNFRRALDKSGLVKGTGKLESSTGGRPAELYTFRHELLKQQIVMGVATPARRLSD